jgi:hypothetical protein
MAAVDVVAGRNVVGLGASVVPEVPIADVTAGGDVMDIDPIAEVTVHDAVADVLGAPVHGDASARFHLWRGDDGKVADDEISAVAETQMDRQGRANVVAVVGLGLGIALIGMDEQVVGSLYQCLGQTAN